MLSSKAGPSWQRNAKKKQKQKTINSLRYSKSGRTGLATEFCSHNDPHMSGAQIDSIPHLHCMGVEGNSGLSPVSEILGPKPTHIEHYPLSAAHANTYLSAYNVMTNTFRALFTYWHVCDS